MPEFAHKVLVVDDSQLMHSLYECLLEGIHVLHANDGIEALEVLAATPDVDLVLLDIDMPRMDGLAVLEHMRRDANAAHIPVVVVTSYGSQDDVERGLTAGANAYVTKPFGVSTLTVMVQELLVQKPAPRR